MVASNEFKYIFEDDFEVESWTSLHAKTYLETGVFVSVIIAPHDALQDAVLLIFLPGGDLQVAQHQLVLKATFIRHHLSGCGQDTIFLLNDQQTKVKSVFPKLTDCLVNGKKIKSLMTKRIWHLIIHLVVPFRVFTVFVKNTFSVVARRTLHARLTGVWTESAAWTIRSRIMRETPTSANYRPLINFKTYRENM